MKNFSWLIGLLLMTSLTGCIDIFEKLVLNKDGSGTYTFTMDMSAMLEMADFFQGMQSMFDEEDMDEPLDPEMDNYLGRPSGDNEQENNPFGEDVDRLYYLRDLSDDEKPELTHAHLMDKVFVHQIMNREEGVFSITFGIDFKTLSDIDDMMEDMPNFMPAGDDNDMMAGMGMSPGSMMPAAKGRMFELKGKKLIRANQDNSGEEEMLESSEMAMLSMLLAGGKYRATYELPGNVRSVEGKNAVSEGNKVTVSHDLDKFITGSEDFSLEITFR